MGRVVHFEIPASDPEKAVEFYRNVFGWKIERWGEVPYWMVETGPEDEAGINGAITGKAGDGVVEVPEKIIDAAHAINTVITIDVPNMDEAIAEILKHGGTIVMDPWPIEGVGIMAYFTDLDDNILCIMQSESKS